MFTSKAFNTISKVDSVAFVYQPLIWTYYFSQNYIWQLNPVEIYFSQCGFAEYVYQPVFVWIPSSFTYHLR